MDVVRAEALAFGLIGLCLVPARGGEPPAFEQQVLDPAGIAYQRQVADLDGDGHNDVVAIDETHLYWFRAPQFARQNLLTLSSGTHGYPLFRADDLQLADLDGDGDLDAAVRIGDSGDVNGKVVWLRNPRPAQPVTGTWTHRDVGVNTYVKDIAIADVDRDTRLDIITRETQATQIWFQNTPTSWTRKSIDHPSHEGLAVADLDQDGDPDIVLNGFWLQTPSAPRTGAYTQRPIDSQWFTGQSGGQDWQYNNCKVAVADIDGNAAPDVVLSHSELPGYPVSWYSAADPVNGPWVEHVLRPQCDYCHNLQAADFDGDGDADVLSGGMIQSPQRGLTLHLNNGSGTSWTPLVIQQLGSYSAEIGDLDDDADLDIVTIRQWDQPPTELWRNLLPPALPGDVDGDCAVTITDLGILLGNYGLSPAAHGDGDVSGDGQVNISDLGIVLEDFGATCR